ncbi:MAG: gamma carbonic anhydrase family protein [Lachnospiraceae bacterium]|nr:gamma carbonic anhydrase family protein [Lachnospiraceae bacterium]
MKQPFFKAEGAVIVGDVTFEEESSVWFNAVIRGDAGPISIGRRSNIQDNCTLHLDHGTSLTIGDDVTVGHNAILHGCTIGDNVIIGMGAIVMNGAVIGSNSIIGAGAIVTERSVIPENSLVIGIPGKVKRELTMEEIAAIRKNAAVYVEEAKAYLAEKHA